MEKPVSISVSTKVYSSARGVSAGNWGKETNLQGLGNVNFITLVQEYSNKRKFNCAQLRVTDTSTEGSNKKGIETLMIRIDG